MNATSATYYRMLFRSAALFNWVVGLILVFAYNPFFQFLDMPSVENPLFLHLFALLVLMFGLGYYWISLDPPRERSLILLGCIAKGLVFLTFVTYFCLGQLSWQFLALVTGDLFYSLAFAECLLRQNRLLELRTSP